MNEKMSNFVAFGEKVPQSIIDELIADGMSEKDINTEFLEAYLWYEHCDNE